MDARPPVALLVVLGALAASGGCGFVTPFRVAAEAGADGGTDGDVDLDGDVSVDADGARDADDLADAEVDDDRPAAPGPLTLVATALTVELDRLCDIDGDGDLDNAVRDVGEPAATVARDLLGTIFGGSIDTGRRLLVHFPLIDDVVHGTDDEAVMIFFQGDRADGADRGPEDFAGSVAFCIMGDSLDGCGEPRFFFRSVRLHRGTIVGRDGIAPIPSQDLEPSRHVEASGQVRTGGPGTVIHVCGAVLVHDAGGVPAPPIFGDLSLLEAFLAGGASAGAPAVPGIKLDLDLDGDGIEQIQLDDDFHIDSCIDGDRTVIRGRDCWQDERMGDGISYVARWEMTTARLDDAERECPPDDDPPDGSVPCDGGPPDGSLFDPR